MGCVHPLQKQINQKQQLNRAMAQRQLDIRRKNADLVKKKSTLDNRLNNLKLSSQWVSRHNQIQDSQTEKQYIKNAISTLQTQKLSIELTKEVISQRFPQNTIPNYQPDPQERRSLQEQIKLSQNKIKQLNKPKIFEGQTKKRISQIDTLQGLIKGLQRQKIDLIQSRISGNNQRRSSLSRNSRSMKQFSNEYSMTKLNQNQSQAEFYQPNFEYYK